MSEETNIETTETATEATTGEERKSRELLNELKQAKSKLAEFERQQEEREVAESKKKGDYEALLQKEKDKAAKLVKEREDALNQSNARINQLLTDNTIKGIITAHEVQPALAKALTALLKSEMTIGDEGAMFGDKSPEDFAKEFFATEEGQAFLKPDLKSGGGSTGNTTNAPATPDYWDFTAYADMKKTDPVLAAAYAKKHNQAF